METRDMELRKTLGAAALITAATMASVAGCSGREDDGDPDPTSDAGCIGNCGADSGTDAGTDAGLPPEDAGPRICPEPVEGKGPIGRLRESGTRGEAVTLDEVIVTAVSQMTRGNQGDYTARFWVVDSCFPTEGIFVDKFYTDETKAYGPVVGDVLRVQGLFRTFNAQATDNAPNMREAYRPVIKSAFRLDVTGATGNLVITKKGSGEPLPDNTVPEGFGDAEGGVAVPNPELGGTRVHIPGPLTITNATPAAMQQRPNEPENDTYLGFEVTGGILVANYKTYNVEGCDVRAAAADGGTVTFENGLRGVWDTYSNVVCTDGGTTTTSDGGTAFQCNQYADGVVPGTTNPYTYVLIPTDCTTDMVGTVTPAEVP
ncbi:hypothetical protein HV824_04020 [Myxococcus sp. AM009]|nr:hypothetical protein [Myxococcus sp. AM009]NVJ12916.1 hypothetical protein [Myxococcus sp. AM010]